jgi:hypothetical protein
VVTGLLVAGTHSTQFWKEARIVNYHTHLKNILRLLKKSVYQLCCVVGLSVSRFLLICLDVWHMFYVSLWSLLASCVSLQNNADLKHNSKGHVNYATFRRIFSSLKQYFSTVVTQIVRRMSVNCVNSSRCNIPRSYFRIDFSHPVPLALLLRKLDFNKIIALN